MCGIAGVLEHGGGRPDVLEDTARRMIAALVHRGPDGSGIWMDASAGVALGHRRLAVLELSDLGAQPMRSSCGRYMTVFNGEIYNYRAIRRELEAMGHRFRGGSDTEVLLGAVAAWGLERALGSFIGMFAFALWDRRERTLYLARDRAGEKPLYYGELGRSLAFGSELGAIAAHPGGAGALDGQALSLYLQFGYVPAPHSIHSNVRKVPPGSFVRVQRGRIFEPESYWSWHAVAERGTVDPLALGVDAATDALEVLLDDAVRLQTAADVPVGAFLSGGVDSSTVVALMRKHASEVRTFSIGFAEEAYDESGYASAVASYLGTTHTALQVTPAEVMAVIPKLATVYAEPFADSSQIPTYLVSELARKQVTVSLSGDGADELFGGYNRYSWAQALWQAMRFVPGSVRKLLERGMTACSPAGVDLIMSAVGRVLPERARLRHPGDKLHKIAALISASDRDQVYQRLISAWPAGEEVLQSGFDPGSGGARQQAELPDFTHRMMLLDGITYLPDDILVKLDRASMANSLEARAPFLDHRIIEFAWRLPLGLKVRNRRGKYLLRQVLHRHVPPPLVDRPKTGFAIPLDSWIRGPLREWAEHLLSERRLRQDGVFRPAPIRRKWREHLSGTRNWIAPLWTVLMFQAWQEQHRPVQRAEADREMRAVAGI